ncbi:hypothetical protein BGZ80_002026 [Entomortierella chlamydospora]|uniref:Uncharacterized protein n=1 Tax=Entomortierella chlamydospora TaxID=101097 RepID=A0A9P6N2W0_9FUNG|nr:hypothetical protein BGZ80_002026 [Entomortierella chlamydospora]
MTTIPTQPTATFEEATQQHPPPNLHDVACTGEENDLESSHSEKDPSIRNKRVKSQKKTHNRTIVSQPSSTPQHGSVNIQGSSFTPQPAMSTIKRVRSPRSQLPPDATSPNGILDTTSRSPAPIPKSEKRGRGRGQNFTIEQELYIAELLADPETWALLDGPGERNDHYMPKKTVHESIATKVNSKFLDEASQRIDGAQIKNKIESMKKQWKTANTFLKKISEGDLTSNDLRKLVEDKCCFYYILQVTWSTSWSLNPRDPVQLTGNLTRPPICDFGIDASEEEDDPVVEQDNASTGEAS